MRLASWKLEQQSKKYPILEQILLQKSFMRLAPGWTWVNPENTEPPLQVSKENQAKKIEDSPFCCPPDFVHVALTTPNSCV